MSVRSHSNRIVDMITSEREQMKLNSKQFNQILTSASTGALHQPDGARDGDRGSSPFPRKSQSLALLRADALAYAESDRGGIAEYTLVFFISV